MQTFIWIVRYLISAGVVGFVTLDFMNRLFGGRYKRWTDWLVFTGFVMLCIFIDFLRVPLCNIAYTLISLTVISYVFYHPHKKKFEYTLIFLLYITLLDLLITPLLASLNELPLTHIMHRPFTAMFYEVITKSALICTYRILLSWFKRSPSGSIDNKQNFLLLVIFLFQVTIGSALTGFIDGRKTAFVMAIIGAGFLVMDLYIVYLLDYVVINKDLQARMELSSQRAALQNQHYQEVELINQQSRAILHDLHNHIQMLSGLYGNRQYDAYAKQLLQKVDSLDSQNICSTPILNVILAVKRQSAQAKGIRLMLDVQEVPWDGFDEMDVTTIFANLLDNAIEACEALPEPQRSITLRIHSFQGYIVLNIRNPYTGPIPPLLKDHAERSGKEGHWGIGLLNVREAVEKYEGSMKVDLERDEFIVKVVLKTT